VEERNNEIELLITVTPEFVEAMDAHETPPCGPGQTTTTPDDCDFYWRGYLEVPNCCGDDQCQFGSSVSRAWAHDGAAQGGAAEEVARGGRLTDQPSGSPPGRPTSHREVRSFSDSGPRPAVGVPAAHSGFQRPYIPNKPPESPASRGGVGDEGADGSLIGPFGYDVLR
jgi:hypothetical protein